VELDDQGTTYRKLIQKAYPGLEWDAIHHAGNSSGIVKAGLTADDIDLWEVNEAFAVVAEKFIRDLRLDREKVNVNGGAIALGHPIGATGAILIGTMVDEPKPAHG